MKRKIAKLFALLGVMVLLAGCGGGGGGGGGGSSSSSGTESNVVSKWVANYNTSSEKTTTYITFYTDKTYTAENSGTLEGVEGYLKETGTYTGNANADGEVVLTPTNTELSPSWSSLAGRGSAYTLTIAGNNLYPSGSPSDIHTKVQ